jgi:membrane-bound lytic murein transglycosylase D
MLFSFTLSSHSGDYYIFKDKLGSDVYGQTQELPKPELVKQQIDFWKKIFVRYNDQQTIIHDKENPQLIYKVVEHFNYPHFKRIDKVRFELKSIRLHLQKIAKKRLKNLTEDEKNILSKIPSEYHKNIASLIERVRYQQGMSNRVKEGIYQSQKYLPLIKKIIDENELPYQLANIPHIESSFNYKAYSKVGAAGIWQFMPSSARHFGLIVSDNYDQRLDPIAATYAAIKMLKANYRILKSWPLAITAYNHGPYSLKKAVAKLGTSDFEEILKRYHSRSFEFASQNFYSSFLTAIEVSDNAKFYYDDIKFQEPLDMEVIKLKKATNYNKLAKDLRITKAKLFEYNPSIRVKFLSRNPMIPRHATILIPKKNPKPAIAKLGR